MDKDDLRNALFEGVVNVLQDKDLQKVISSQHKQAVLDALEVSVEAIDDKHVRMTFMFIVMDIDTTNEDNPSVTMSFDLANLNKFL